MKTLNFKLKPQGYIKRQMKEELRLKVLGNLHNYSKDLFEDDIYVKDRIGKNTKPKDLGTLENSDDWNVQFYWWNSETISNYYDGLMRYGFLLDNEEIINQINGFVERILSSQDKDGYIGIYQEDMRYNFNSENGELWSKATLYRVLLGYYFYTNNNNVLEAVKKAVSNVMENYKKNESTPFKGDDTFAGAAHGLMFIDVLYSLYEITNDYEYVDYALFLYEDYNKHNVSEKDILLSNLNDDDYRFEGHGVHTYEHLRALAILAKFNPDHMKNYNKYMEKLNYALSPSGGPIGDEWVMGNIAKSDMHGYEFCSIFELMDSLLFVSNLAIDNQYELADKIFRNANLGAKHNERRTIAYLKSDNSYEMKGSFQCEQSHSPHQIQSRYKYSPTHQDAAVCCVPNSARITPYYLEHAITFKDDKVYLNYIAPLNAIFEIKGEEYYISIEQETPYSDYKIKTNLGNKLKTCEEFDDKILTMTDHYGEVYFMNKNIVFALPINYKDDVIKEYDEFQHDVYCEPISSFEPYTYDGDKLSMVNSLIPTIETTLYENNNPKKVSLIPIGETVLRQVTFKRRR